MPASVEATPNKPRSGSSEPVAGRLALSDVRVLCSEALLFGSGGVDRGADWFVSGVPAWLPFASVAFCVPVADGAAAAEFAVLGVCWAELISVLEGFGVEEVGAGFLAVFCWLISADGEAVGAGLLAAAPVPIPVLAEADGPPPVLPDPQWSEMSLTFLT